MSEFSNHGHESIQSMESAIKRATEIVSGETGADPLEVFPNPADKERRADIVWGGHLTVEQQEAFRGVMAELGPGREDDIGPDELGLEDRSYVALLEGGQPHKMIAELEVITNADSQPSAIFVAASPDRKLGEKEQALGTKLLGLDGEQEIGSEKEMAEQIFKSRDDFEPEVYTPEHDIEPIGRLGGLAVKIMIVRRVYQDAERYVQPTNQDKMVTTALHEDSNVAFVTSATYQPSNEIAAERARRSSPSDAEYFVMSYGTRKLGEVKGEEPVKPSVAQLGAEAYKAAFNLRGL